MPYLHDPNSKEPLWLTKPYMQHNILLSYITETGLLGLTMLLAVLATTTRNALILLKTQNRPDWQRKFGLLFVVFVTSYLVNGMFHDVTIAPMVNMLFLFLAGLTVNLSAQTASFLERIPQSQSSYQRCQDLVATT